MKKKAILFVLVMISFTARSMTPEQYDEIKWAPTNLDSMFLTNTVQYDYCNYNLERFKGCVAAVDRFVKYISVDTAIDVNDGSKEFEFIKEEEFAKRQDDYKKFVIFKRKKLDRIGAIKSDTLSKSLIKIFKQALEIKKELKPHEVAVPVNEFYSIAYDPFKKIEPTVRYNGFNIVRLPPSIGIEVSLLKNKILINRVLVNSPSYHAGLKNDDIILKINDKDLDLRNDDDVDNFFNFKENEIALFTILRDQRKFDVNIKFTYDKYPPVVDKQIKYKGKNYTYLFLSEIPSDNSPDLTCRVFKRILKKFNDQSDGLILDLRNNVGGYSEVAACIASLFLDKPVHLFSENDLIGNLSQKKMSDGERVFEKPVITIVNEATASSGEILAGTLRFHGRSYLVGNRTFGKGIGQITEEFPSAPNSPTKVELHFTSLMVQYPDGQTHQRVGLVPDYNVFYHGEKESDQEKKVMRMEDYAVYPLEFKNGLKTMNKKEMPVVPQKCRNFKVVHAENNLLSDLDWKKDIQLQFALSILRCQK